MVPHPGRLCQTDQQSSRQLALSSEPEANTNGRKLPCRAARLLGGSSSINGMAFVRGQAQDFDTWAQMGNQGWSYGDVLPFFKSMETYEAAAMTNFAAATVRCASPIRNRAMPMFAALIKAAGQVGIPHNPDYNGARPGRHRHEPGDDRRRPPHEHRPLLPRSDPRPPESAYPDRRVDREPGARRQTLHRRALFRWR